MFPKPTKPTRFPNSEEGVEAFSGAQPALVSGAHRAVARDDVPAAGERQTERQLGHGVSERGCGGEHADPALEAEPVVELRQANRPRPSGSREGSRPRPALPRSASRRSRPRTPRERLAEVGDRHRLVPSPDDVDSVGEPPGVLAREHVSHRPEMGVDDDLGALCHACRFAGADRSPAAGHEMTIAVSVASSSVPVWIASPVSRSIQRMRDGSRRSQTSLSGCGKRSGWIDTFRVSSPQRTVRRL